MTPDSTDLREGVPIHDALLALLALVGEWRGGGRLVVASTGIEYTYGQELSISHDGRPFLAHSSRTWLLDPDGNVIRQAFRETGFWRPGTGPDDVELVLAAAPGLVEVLTGTAGDNQWELSSTAVLRTPTAREVAGERRFYAVRGDVQSADVLNYATELAVRPGEYHPHLNGTLHRVH